MDNAYFCYSDIIEEDLVNDSTYIANRTASDQLIKRLKEKLNPELSDELDALLIALTAEANYTHEQFCKHLYQMLKP